MSRPRLLATSNFRFQERISRAIHQLSTSNTSVGLHFRVEQWEYRPNFHFDGIEMGNRGVLQ